MRAWLAEIARALLHPPRGVELREGLRILCSRRFWRDVGRWLEATIARKLEELQEDLERWPPR